jgi:antitoxin HigA-1
MPAPGHAVAWEQDRATRAEPGRSPGEFIREEILDELGLSVTCAAELLGVRSATLSDLVSGRAALSPEMALRIEKAFGVSMDTLLRMQAWHDSYIMRQRAGEIAVQRFVREGWVR